MRDGFISTFFFGVESLRQMKGPTKRKKEKVQFSPLNFWPASVFPPRTIKPEIFPPPTLKTVRFTSLAGFERWFCYSNGGFATVTAVFSFSFYLFRLNL
jgi:hypothetical protein